MKFVVLFFLLFSSIFYGQELTLSNTLPLNADRFIGVDQYNHLYFLKNRILHKQGGDGNFVFNDLQLGRITSVDIINPLKIVVFFQDTNTVVLLDNKLNEIQRINFNMTSPFLNIGAATTAGNNSLWIFNLDSQQLEHYNYTQRAKKTVSQPFSGQLISMVSNFNYCFALTPNKLRAYNVYGSFLNEIEVTDYDAVVQENANIVLRKDNTLQLIVNFALQKSKQRSEPVPLNLPEMNIKDLYLSKELLYIYDGKNLHSFKLTLPNKN